MYRHVADATTTPAPATTHATISAPEMARLTGVGRERLRTWERRHGFPEPVRTPNGARRYLASDVQRVVAVARAIELGVAVRQAVADLRASSVNPADAPSLALERAFDECSQPMMAVSGPAPLTISWCNASTLQSVQAPALGTDLADASVFAGTSLATLVELMNDEEGSGRVIELRDWTSEFPQMTQVLAWRLAPTAADAPTVMLMQLPEAPAAAGVPQLDATTSWSRAAAKSRQVLTSERGLASAQRGLATFLQSTGGVDGFLAIHRGSTLRAATSAAGSLPARTIDCTPGDDLAQALASSSTTWLSERAAGMLGAPSLTRVLALPLAAGGERLGAMFLIYRDVIDTPEIVTELLLGLGMTFALTLQREHLAASMPMRAAA